MGDSLRASKCKQPPRPTQPGHPSVGRCNAGDGSVTAMEENGEFCIAVGPATRTAGILIQLVKGLAVKVSQPSG